MTTEQTPKYETNVSDERLDIILSNECGAPPGLATSRFRRLANEIADRDERIARLEGALNAAPTEAPVPLAAQIEKIRREVGYAQEDHAEKAERLWSAILATLQQHERAMAVLREKIFRYDVLGAHPFGPGYGLGSQQERAEMRNEAAQYRKLAGELREILAALDDAAVTATPAGKGGRG